MYSKNLKIIVTGSEGLLGQTICKFLEKNNQVIRLDLSLGHDLTDETFVKYWFEKNKGDCLINCFAVNDHVEENQRRPTLFEISLESFSNFLHVNLTSLFSVCREFARNNDVGTIINFSASTGIVSARPDLYDGGHKHIAYSVSKAGVINLTKFLATHLAPKIRVNCIAPGGAENSQSPEFIAKYSSLTPLKRMMKKDELNGIMDYLCSSYSSYVTGATFVVDGGWTIW
jgi:NAD(P)-dependent dehydrogenase (short-subunit alcohol dehydrogenase family)